MSLMALTKSIASFMPARIGPLFLQHSKFIALFSLLTLYSIPTAIIAIKKGQIKKYN